MTVRTTEDGDARTYTTKVTTVTTPEAPTTMPDPDGDTDQALLKFFPSAVPKVSPTSTPDNDDGGGGLSTGQLGGIIAGAVAFLIIILVGAYIIIRHLNQVVAAVSTTKQSSTDASRPPMRHKLTDSEIDALSVDPLMMSPRPSVRPRRHASTPDYQFSQASLDLSMGEQTPTSFGGAYQIVSPGSDGRHPSVDGPGGMVSYFDTLPARPARFSQQSGATTVKRTSKDSQGTYAPVRHGRHYSNASEGSTDNEAGGEGRIQTPMELEATPFVPELMGSPTDEGRRSFSGTATGEMPKPPLAHQRKRSESRLGRDSSVGPTPLGVVSEEIHGFHGPSDRMMGQTGHRPETRGSGRGGLGSGEGGRGSGPAAQ